MRYKKILANLLIISLILVIIPSGVPNEEDIWWNQNWSYRQEVEIPIDTSICYGKNQPIDVFTEFNNPCWALNENEHSIRVIFQKDNLVEELESQVYDLEFISSNSIKSCNLVFLIPDYADGSEKYYLYYDDDEKVNPNYPDHVFIESSYYYYEPIRGLPFESWYYKIIEKEKIIYAISQEGSFMDSSVSHQVIKLIPNSKILEAKHADKIASFHLNYWYFKDDEWIKSSTSENLISKDILVDGNLMVKFIIKSESNDGLFQTTTTYKYYYCPTEDKRIFTHVKHKVLNQLPPEGDKIDVSFIRFMCGGIKSSAIEDLNFGNIPNSLHIYDEEEEIISLELDQYPESEWETVIAKNEDYDLGSKAWISVDDGENGKVHGVIFGSNKVLKSGTNEKDGIEIQLYKSRNIQVPGLDGRFVFIDFSRNACELGEPCDEVLPRDFEVEFDAEFFTAENGGYKKVDQEATIYQLLVKNQPNNDNSLDNKTDTRIDKKLTVFTHLPASLWSKLMISRILGLYPCISVEVHQEKEIYAAGTCSRIAIKGNIGLDFRNFSFFRKTIFSHLPPGEYHVKIWLEKSSFNHLREFIGFSSVDLQEDTIIHVLGRPEGLINISIAEQNDKGLEGAIVYLKDQGTNITTGVSNSYGHIILRAPSNIADKYTLSVEYDGFLIHESEIRLTFLNNQIPLKKIVNVDTHDLKINIINEDNKTSELDFNFSITSNEMITPTIIKANKTSNGEYLFSSLYPANYTINISYKDFEIENQVSVPNVSEINIELFDLKVKIKDNMSLAPEAKFDMILYSDCFKKSIILEGENLSKEDFIFRDLYPGKYNLKIQYKSFTLEKEVDIPFDSNEVLFLDFPAVFNLTATIIDERGNLLKDAKIILIRENVEIEEFTDENGIVRFLVPPGVYHSKIFSSDKLIAERNIEVTNSKSIIIATIEQPLIPLVVIIISIFAFIIFSFFIFYLKEDPMEWLKVLIILFVIISIFSPWWMIHGYSSDIEVETSSQLFLIPTELITITSFQDDIVAGEISSLGEDFKALLDFIPILSFIGILCIFSNIILIKLGRAKLNFIILISSMIVLISALLGFIIGIFEFTEVVVGSFVGCGDLSINIPGEGTIEALSCSWGPGFGFYLFIISLFILIFVFIVNIKRKLL